MDRRARPRPAERIRAPVTLSRRATVAAAAITAALLVGVGLLAPAAQAAPARPGHVFVINLENKGFDETWGPTSRRRT